MSTTTMTTTDRPTWEDLATREPRLTQLRQAVEQVSARGNPRFCANATWYGSAGGPNFRGQVMRLVGWHAENPDPVLHTMAAYDLVYQVLYDLLPDCRDCACAPRWVA